MTKVSVIPEQEYRPISKEKWKKDGTSSTWARSKGSLYKDNLGYIFMDLYDSVLYLTPSDNFYLGKLEDDAFSITRLSSGTKIVLLQQTDPYDQTD